jgi:peptidoglycan hydrolase CwlO-like protein/surface antigen
MLTLKEMKLRSTTPTSNIKQRVILSVVAALVALSMPIAMATRTYADQYDARIAALQQQIDQYQAAAQQLGAQADSLQRTLDGINNEISQIQAQIDLTQVQYDQLIVKIKDTEKQIAENRDALGEVIADLSIEGKISPLEMLASSKNIADYVDKQTYQSSMQDQLKSTIDRIKELKALLDKQKQQTEELLANQKRSREALAAKQAEQQKLVNETRGQESAYAELRNRTKEEQLQVMQQQAAAIRAASARNGGVAFVGGSDGGYPWNSSNCYVDAYAMSYGGADGNGGDGWGYGCRQCASYAAWKIGQRTGVIPTHLGDAVDFPSSLSNYPQGYTARANSVGVITSSGRPGHVVWVETDPDAGGFITVSQYNANYTGNSSNWGNFTRVRVHQSTYNKFIYF